MCNTADRTILYGLTTCKYTPILFGSCFVRHYSRVRACTRYGPVTKKQTFLAAASSGPIGTTGFQSGEEVHRPGTDASPAPSLPPSFADFNGRLHV